MAKLILKLRNGLVIGPVVFTEHLIGGGGGSGYVMEPYRHSIFHGGLGYLLPLEWRKRDGRLHCGTPAAGTEDWEQFEGMAIAEILDYETPAVIVETIPA